MNISDPDLGSRGQKGTGSWIQIRSTASDCVDDHVTFKCVGHVRSYIRVLNCLSKYS
jgi:hypothetical protein